MKLVQLFFLLLAGVSLLFLAVGLYRPWTMLWWEDVQNRRKVIKVYGVAAFFCLAIYLVINIFL